MYTAYKRVLLLAAGLAASLPALAQRRSLYLSFLDWARDQAAQITPAPEIVRTLPTGFALTPYVVDEAAEQYYVWQQLPAGLVPRLRTNRLYGATLGRAPRRYGFGEEQVPVGSYLARVPYTPATQATLASLFAHQADLATRVRYVWVRGEVELSGTGFPLRELDKYYPTLVQLADSSYWQAHIEYVPRPPDSLGRVESSSPYMVRSAAGRVVQHGSPSQCKQFRQLLLKHMTQGLQTVPFEATPDLSLELPPGELRFERSHKPSLIGGAPLFERVVYLFNCLVDDDNVYAYFDFVLTLATGPKGDFLEPDLQYPAELARYEATTRKRYLLAVKTVCQQLQGTFEESRCTCKLTP